MSEISTKRISIIPRKAKRILNNGENMFTGGIDSRKHLNRPQVW